MALLRELSTQSQLQQGYGEFLIGLHPFRPMESTHAHYVVLGGKGTSDTALGFENCLE